MRSRLGRTIAIVLLALAAVPLAAAAYLFAQVMSASERVATGEAELRKGALEQARAAYRELFAERKAALREAADRLAREVAALPAGARAARLSAELDRDPKLAAVELGGFSRKKTLSAGEWRELRVDEPDGLGLVYVTPRAPFVAFDALGDLESSEAGLKLVRERLRTIYQAVFLGAFVLVVGVTLAIGLLLGRRLSRRVSALGAATRAVGQGDLSARVTVEGRDELADLGRAFNQMVVELAESRDRISYLQKIGAWQEVARRLAHEIKNPLTPIQLAMQQLQSSWPGGDEKFARALQASSEIVTEEIAGLRRLVDEFSAFAKLPAVQASPVDAAALIDDFLRSYSDLRVEFAPPAEPVLLVADRMLVKRALYNLVANAREAGAKSIRISVENGALVVDDDGPGVPPELALFDPYVTTKEHGTGLGLAIVRKIALEHGGDVTCGKSPQGGARFTLTLRRA
jgi:two-component system, NtrC family, nitrogen regulation sensor histidine kinase NtrY